MAKAFKNSQNNADVINERPLMAVVGVQLLVVLVRVIFKMAIFHSLAFLWYLIFIQDGQVTILI